KKFRQNAEETAAQICETLGTEPTNEQRTEIINLIEQLTLKIAVDTRNWCADHATRSSATGQTLAEELHTEHDALLTNLTSMR
ncbi:MAG: hypothetical protein VW644_00845, partial [Alphaproteobacteria bacterium]